MSLTPIQEIESASHAQFESPPTKEELGQFLQKQYPKMDGGAAIAIALAALVLQGWQVYRAEQARRAAAGGGSNRCPQCKLPEVRRDKDGRAVCENQHTW